MAVVHLTQAICDRARAGERRYDLRDECVRGLFLRVERTGRKTWYLNYRTPPPDKRLRNKKLVSASFVKLAEARKLAKGYLANLYLYGKDPAESGREAASMMTLRELIDTYEPWVMSHQKSGAVTMRTLRLFTEFMDMPASSITSEVVETWQAEKLGRIKRASINRRVAALQAVMSWGVHHKLISEVPFRAAKLTQTDSKTVTRFLSDAERARLMDELDGREERQGRDYLKPAVILSMNTGIRKGTLLGLMWEDVDMEHRVLNLRAEIMKAGKSAVIPLNDMARRTLADWQKFTKATSGYIFPAENGRRRADVTRAFGRIIKKAGIEDFTWHCLRHDFASRLAIAGTPLQIIQKLLCHGSIAMTQRYAHLSDSVLAKAVEILGS